MSETDEIFISYSHDSVEHVERVLDLSDKLRSEGVDCVLDQYEISPPEGWPRWMDKKIRDFKFVILVCTENYYRRVMGEEEEGKGLGVRWEGNIIYQHFYNTGAISNKFIPVIYCNTDQRFIPVPLQGATYYSLEAKDGYDDLYRRLTDQPKVKKPKLGKKRALSHKAVKTNPNMYITSPIDIDLWDKAKWRATFFSYMPNRPPILGLAFRNKEEAVKIFEGWHKRYGSNDEYEELRIAIVEGEIKDEKPGYTVHITGDPDNAIKRFRDAGYEFDDDIFMSISRINRMNPPPESNNLQMFKQLYTQYKTYYLAPGVISKDGTKLEPLYELGIYKSNLTLKSVTEITEHDIDQVVLRTGSVKRRDTKWE